MGYRLRSTDLQDLERRKEGMLSEQNNDVRGIKMEKFKWREQQSRKANGIRAQFIYSLNIWQFTTRNMLFQAQWIQCRTRQFNSVQLLSHVQLFATPWITARQASLSITNSWSLFKLISIELVMPSNHLILCRPLLLLPSIPPSIRVFSNESTLHIR